MSNMLQSVLNILVMVGLVIACVAIVVLPLELIRLSYRTRKKRIAIRTYAERIGKLLRVRYGLLEKYTPAQVQGMIREWGYSTIYDHYGLAMYCDYADFMNHYRAIGRRYKYEMIRSEISHCLFRVNIMYSVSDVIGARKQRAQSNKKRLAIQRYIKHIGPELRKRYGVQREYTTDQVKQTVSNSLYSSDYDCYSFALYCSHDDFLDYHRTIGESCDYNSMRSEISDSFHSGFPNGTTFDACDVIDFSDRIDIANDVGDSSSWWSNILDFGIGSGLSSDGSDTSYESDFSGGGDSSSGSD
jgi:hypothetical protein